MQENLSKQGLNGFPCQFLITKIVNAEYTSRMIQCFFFKVNNLTFPPLSSLPLPLR